ncbi:hypothetical protein LMG24238_05618 [Paraburkholderia sediminicola]|uniref:Autotransporter domain-containing protein n=1 Tax=Paraburkholderia sediminicola TaxID=458836 RepID=A0A6J5CAQ6_9BURK|nr:autotransporter outer membrane beta-barrel domain-containing protein [Paraburkholderia sediminicola]CAB3729785.1 hypothetical protein LMG24238_05618 [Paraburkholderia sediminicola]
MNHAYLVIWNAATSTWCAVSETAVRRKKGARRLTPLCASLLLIGFGASLGQAHADTIAFPANSTVDIGSATETVDSLTISNGVTGTIIGADGTLVYSGGDFRLGGTLNGTTQTLDMSGLTNFASDNPARVFSVGGQIGAGAAVTGTTNGTLTLAAGNNTITAQTFGVANRARSVSSLASNTGTVLLGQNNTINADVIAIGANQSNGTLTFQSGITDGRVVLRGTDGTSAVSTWDIGVGSNSNYTGGSGTVNLSQGTLDAKVDNLTIGSAIYGSQTATGSLVMGDGLLDANSITVGQRTSTSGAGGASGTLTIGNGTVRTRTLTIGDRSGTTGSATGVVNLNGGGSLLAQTIHSGAGAATRTINWNNGTIGNYADGADMTISGANIVLAGTGTHTFQIDGADAVGTVNSTLSNASGQNGTLVKAGSGTLALTANNTYSGGTTVKGGLVNFRTLSNLGTGKVTLDGGGLQWATGNTVDVSSRLNALGQNGAFLDTNGNNVTLAQNLSGDAGVLVKQGAGTLTLTGNNTYDGGTQIDAGTLQIGNGGAVGSIQGDVLNNSALVVNRSDAVTLSGAISGTGTLTQAGPGTTILTGDSTFTGTTTIDAGVLQLGDGGTSGSMTGPIVNNAVLAIDRADTAVLPGVISGTGSLTQMGAGTTVLAGENTYSGGTTIDAGTLQIGNGGTTGSIIGDVTNNGTLAFNRADTVTFSNLISGTGGLVQAGPGTLNLEGDQTYSGPTTVQGGMLAVNGSIQSATKVAAGGTLGGYGTIIGDVQNAGVVAPGSAGTPGDAFGDLTIRGNYAGDGGKLVLNTVLGDDSSATDRLVIDGSASSAARAVESASASGDTALVIRKAGGTGAQTNVGIQLVSAVNGATTEAGAFKLDSASDGYRKGFGTVSAGGYDYMLERGGNGGNAQDWYLVSAAQPVDPVDPVKPVAPIDPVAPVTPTNPGEQEDNAGTTPVTPTPSAQLVTPEPDAYLGNAWAATMMPIHTLHQRQGQAGGNVDDGTGVDGAAWVRVEGQSMSMTSNGRDISGNNRTIHAGSDVLRFKDGGDGSFRVGVMGMYGSATNWSTRELWNPLANSYQPATARGSVEGYNVGLYGTWYGNRDILSGPYVDTWLMYGAYSNTVGGSLATDSYRSSTVTGSLEGGYSIPVYQRGDTRVFVEPQAQVIYSHYSADEHAAPAGLIGGQSDNSVLTRLGVRLHGTTPVGNGGAQLRPFVEANWWHGPTSQSVTVDGNAFNLAMPANRMELKTGLQGQVTKNLSVTGTVGVETNLGGYSVVKGQLAAKYSWK